MLAYPSSSPFPNNCTLSLLWVGTFSWVPSAVAFHSPALSVLLPLPSVHRSLFPKAVSTLTTLAHNQGMTSRA